MLQYSRIPCWALLVLVAGSNGLVIVPQTSVEGDLQSASARKRRLPRWHSHIGCGTCTALGIPVAPARAAAAALRDRVGVFGPGSKSWRIEPF